jgi:transcription antitermination factor NusG
MEDIAVRAHLTDRFCSTAKSTEQVDYFDDTVRGLALRVSPTVKSWSLIYSRPGGKRARLTLGRYPAVSLAAARTRALEAKSAIAEGRPLAAAAGMAAYLPVELVRTNFRGSRRSEVRWRPLFPGHLFVELDPSRDLPELRKIDGVDDVVRPGGRPAPIADDVINAIRRAERDGLFDAAAGCRLVGGEASPPDGRFAGLVAKIKSARWSKERMQLLMSLMVSK